MHPEEHILQSWHTNAGAWTKAISTESISSRKLVTNKAIIDAVLQEQPASLLDIGCGEGWLCRALTPHNIKTTGIDAIPDLISAAKQQGPQAFFQYTYQEIVSGKFQNTAPYDAVLFNFSLFGDELVDELLKVVKAYLSPLGKLIIQTLHPHAFSQEAYVDGWKSGSWSGFSDEFRDPAPWYFRKMETWVNLFSSTGYQLKELVEPIHPHTGRPASVIFVCTKKI